MFRNVFWGDRYAQLPEVHLKVITRRHLVSYSPQTDLLPLVLAHCNYSLHLGYANSAAVEYDFSGFELQLRNTLLLSKSRVHRNENGSMEVGIQLHLIGCLFQHILQLDTADIEIKVYLC